MNQYYDRKKLMNLARECAIQAEASGYILCEEVSFFFSLVSKSEVKVVLMGAKGVDIKKMRCCLPFFINLT